MNIDFRKITVEINFEGEKKGVDVHKELANYAKTRTTDIGFEDFCREIYHKGEVDINDDYKKILIGILSEPQCPFFAYIKRGIINALKKDENGNDE